MKPEFFFPLFLILGNFGACTVYFLRGKPVMGCYWGCALGLNVCVFILGRAR